MTEKWTEEKLREALEEQDLYFTYDERLSARDVDQIMSLIKSATHLKGNEKLPNCMRFLKQQDNYPLSPSSYFDKSEMERCCPMCRKDFKSTEEWKK